MLNYDFLNKTKIQIKKNLKKLHSKLITKKNKINPKHIFKKNKQTPKWIRIHILNLDIATAIITSVKK